MKKSVSSFVLGLVMLFGAAHGLSAFGQQISKSVVITRDSKLGAEPLPKGEYAVKFVEGKDGELVFVRGSREVLKATYKVAELKAPASDSSVAFTLAPDGSYQLKRIE